MQLRTVPVCIDDTLLCGVTGETGFWAGWWPSPVTLKSHVSKMLQVASSKPLGPDIDNLFSYGFLSGSLRGLSAHRNTHVTCVLSLHQKKKYTGYKQVTDWTTRIFWALLTETHGYLSIHRLFFKEFEWPVMICLPTMYANQNTWNKPSAPKEAYGMINCIVCPWDMVFCTMEKHFQPTRAQKGSTVEIWKQDTYFMCIHPWRLTWNIVPWRFGSDHFPFLNSWLCRFHVNLPGALFHMQSNPASNSSSEMSRRVIVAAFTHP